MTVPVVSAGVSPAPAAGQESEKSLAGQLPRIEPVEPEESLGTFTVQNGFRLELVAAEPDVSDPVDACFDERGWMYVAEMHGYPFSHEPTRLNPQGGGKYNAGIVRLLEDADGDGRYERSRKFADDITWPVSVCCYDGGVFVLAPPHLHYFKDTDGDGRADVRRIVFSGFDRGNVQSLANNLKWTLDNRIAFAGGRNRGTLVHEGQEILPLGRTDVVFNPRTEVAEPITGGVQFGLCFDDWGNRFVCSNSDHIQHVVFAYRYLERNPLFAVSGAIRSIAKEGAAAPVFRKSPAEPWRVVRTRRRVADPEFRKRLSYTERFAIGYFTSATGVTIYRGGAYPPEYRGNAFIGDVGGNLVHRKAVEPEGASFVAARADENAEFIASTDNWFRPVNFVNAPDGTLYILDMYRETIEHPHSIPEDIKAHLDLESGDDRGRIYRLVAPEAERKRPPNLAVLSTVELVGQLESPNSWNRETAQRLLWERQDAAAVGPLVDLARSSEIATAQLHALYTLEGQLALTPEILAEALQDSHAGVRRHAVRLAEARLDSSPGLLKQVVALAEDANAAVRFQAALSLGESKSPQAVRGLARLARGEALDADLRAAILTSVSGNAEALAVELLNDPQLAAGSAQVALIGELAGIVGGGEDREPALSLLGAACAADRPLVLRRRVLSSLGEGLRRRGSSITELLESEPADSAARQGVRRLFRQATRVSGEESRSVAEREAAIGVLAFADAKSTAGHLEGFLTPQVPQTLQVAAVRSLLNQENKSVAELLLAQWRGFSPQVRREVVDGLLSGRERIEALLAAVEAGEVQPGEIERDKKQLLLNHPQTAVRDRSRELFGSEVSPDRAEVVSAYQTTLELEGNLKSGAKLFEKNCAVCHRVGEKGHAVGPDLASVLNKSDADLLVSILDPNREAQPNFTSYTVVSREGRIYNGMIAEETAGSLTLRRAEGKDDVVLRSNIDLLVSNGKSLMPEGLEKELSVQQMADVLAYIRTIKPEKP